MFFTAASSQRSGVNIWDSANSFRPFIRLVAAIALAPAAGGVALSAACGTERPLVEPCPTDESAVEDVGCHQCQALQDGAATCEVLGCFCQRTVVEADYVEGEYSESCLAAQRPPAAPCHEDGGHGCDEQGRCLRGQERWTLRVGSFEGELAGMGGDATGRIVVAGSFVAGFSRGDVVLESAGAQDIFVASFDADGTEQWLRIFGDAGEQHVSAVAVHGDGTIVLAGSFEGALALSREVSLVSPGRSLFVAALARDGEPLWAQRIAHTPDGEPIARVDRKLCRKNRAHGSKRRRQGRGAERAR